MFIRRINENHDDSAFKEFLKTDPVEFSWVFKHSHWFLRPSIEL